MLVCFRKCPVATVTIRQHTYKYLLDRAGPCKAYKGKEIMTLGLGKVKNHLQNPFQLSVLYVESPWSWESAYRQSLERAKLLAWQAAVAGAHVCSG